MSKSSFNFNVFEQALLNSRQKDALQQLCTDHPENLEKVRPIFDFAALCKFIGVEDIIDQRVQRSVRKVPTYGQVLMMHLMQLSAPDYKGLQSLHEFANTMALEVFLDPNIKDEPKASYLQISKNNNNQEVQANLNQEESQSGEFIYQPSLIFRPELRYVVGRALEAVYNYDVVEIFNEIIITLFKNFFLLVKTICASQKNLRLNSNLSQAMVAIRQDPKNLNRFYIALPNWAQRLVNIECIAAALDFNDQDDKIVKSLKIARFYRELLKTPFLKDLFRFDTSELDLNTNHNQNISGYGSNWTQKSSEYNFNAQLRRISSYNYSQNQQSSKVTCTDIKESKSSTLSLNDNLSKKDLTSQKIKKGRRTASTAILVNERNQKVNRLVQLRQEAQNQALARVRSLKLLQRLLSEQEIVVGKVNLFEPKYVEKSRALGVYMITKTHVTDPDLKFLYPNHKKETGVLVAPNKRFSKIKDLEINTTWLEDFTYKEELARGLLVHTKSVTEKYKKSYIEEAQSERNEIIRRLKELKAKDKKQLQILIRRLSLKTRACVIRKLDYEPIYGLPRGRHPKHKKVEEVIKGYKLADFEVKIDSKKLNQLIELDNNYLILTNDLNRKFTDYELYCLERFNTSVECDWRLQKVQLNLQSVFLSNKDRIDTFLWFEHLSMFLSEFCKRLVNESRMNV